MNSADAIDRLKSFALDYTMSDFSRGALLDAIDAVRETEGRYLATLTDEGLNGLGYVKLPVDAEGVPIRIGDVIAYEDNTKPKEVVALVPPSVVMVEDGPRYADMCRHYHAPTVEDVLREFADEVQRCCDTDDTIAEYAAKLRLAGDAE